MIDGLVAASMPNTLVEYDDQIEHRGKNIRLVRPMPHC